MLPLLLLPLRCCGCRAGRHVTRVADHFLLRAREAEEVPTDDFCYSCFEKTLLLLQVSR
jgi:hypothetical protein